MASQGKANHVKARQGRNELRRLFFEEWKVRGRIIRIRNGVIYIPDNFLLKKAENLNIQKTLPIATIFIRYMVRYGICEQYRMLTQPKKSIKPPVKGLKR